MRAHRLVAVHMDLIKEGTKRHARWALARPGMDLSDLRALGAWMPEMRYLAERGAIVFDPPLPGAVPRKRAPVKERRSQRVAEERTKPRAARRDRPCMTCGDIFGSEGPHHRMCDRCQGRAGDVSPFEPELGSLPE